MIGQNFRFLPLLLNKNEFLCLPILPHLNISALTCAEKRLSLEEEGSSQKKTFSVKNVLT